MSTRKGRNRDLWNDRVKPGMVVMSAEGDRLGTVKQAREDNFALDREAGFDLDIPYSAIQEINDEFITLKVKSTELDNSGLGTYPYDKSPEPDEAPKPGDIKL